MKNINSKSLEQLEADIFMIMSAKIDNKEKDRKVLRLEKIYRKKGGSKSLQEISNR